MSNMQTFLKDKPYDFVPLLDHCEREKGSSHQIVEQNTYNGKLKLKIEVQSPLHIGGKQWEYNNNNGNIVKKQIRRNGKVIIPGSSLKGAVRAIAEAVSYSCAVKVPDNRMLEIKDDILPKFNREMCLNWEQLCRTCSIFGMIGKTGSYKGKVYFGEFILESGEIEEKELPVLESPFKDYPKEHDIFKNHNINYGNERLYYCKACETGNCLECSKENYFEHIREAGKERKMEFRGRKFYGEPKDNYITTKKKAFYEILKIGSILKGEILFQNLRQEEGELLSYALNIGNHFAMKLGYGKPLGYENSLGYGKIKIELEEVENMGITYLERNSIRKEDIIKWGENYRENSSDKIKDAIKKLEQIMHK